MQKLTSNKRRHCIAGCWIIGLFRIFCGQLFYFRFSFSYFKFSLVVFKSYFNIRAYHCYYWIISCITNNGDVGLAISGSTSGNMLLVSINEVAGYGYYLDE